MGIDQPKVEYNLPDTTPLILNSGIFLLDQAGKPVGIFKLRADNKRLCIQRRSVHPGITDLASRVLVRKLNKIIGFYKIDIPFPLYERPEYSTSSDDELEEFESGLIKYFENYRISEKDLEPHIPRLIKKSRRVLKQRLKEDYPHKQLSDKQKWFYHLVAPLYTTFKKYLTDLETKEVVVKPYVIFHYLAHLLIACKIEELDPKRHHHPVYEKIKTYNYRHRNHLN